MPGLPDPKPARRVDDPRLLKSLHREWRECALCGTTQGRLSLHHIHKHPRDDVRANLVMLCGDGVTGCHGHVELGDHATRRLLGEYVANRRDTWLYLEAKLGSRQKAITWVSVNLLQV